MDNPQKRVLAGAMSGLVATLPMSAVMTLWHRRLAWMNRDPLPPAQITDAVLRGARLEDDLSQGQQDALTVASHFGYGASMGGLFGLLNPGGRPVTAATAGVAYGLAVWGASYLGWLPAAGLYHSAAREARERHLLMIAAHIVWGGSLGLLTHWALHRGTPRSRIRKRRRVNPPQEGDPFPAADERGRGSPAVP